MKQLRKRLTAMAVAAAASVGMLQAFPVSAEENIRLMGDLNDDLLVTATDAQLTVTIYAEALVGNTDNQANEENGNADIDMNGEIDVLDAQSILLYYCQTLVGDQPLWAEFRDVSYIDHAEFGHYYEDEDVEYISTLPFSKTGLYVEIGCAQGAPGEIVDVPVYVAGTEDLAAAVFGIYIPEGLTPVDVTTSVMEDFPPPATNNNDDLILLRPDIGVMGWIRAQAIDVSDGYIIGHFTYQIPEDAQFGDIYQLRMRSDKSMFNSESVQSYEYTLLNGVVVVE